MDYGDSSKLWNLALEFIEKLDKNREMLGSLRKQAEELKVCPLVVVLCEEW